MFSGPFPRSSDVLHIRPPTPVTEAERQAGSALRFGRPRGYFGIPRDFVVLDGQRAPGLREGVAAAGVITLPLPAARAGSPVLGIFNEERIAGRATALAENRVTVLELVH